MRRIFGPLLILAVLVLGGTEIYLLAAKRPPDSGVVESRRMALVHNALVYSVCVRVPSGKVTCGFTSAAAWRACPAGSAWPKCKEES